MKKISILIVTYNHEKYIEQCLTSAINQKTRFQFEIIIGDDCSTDRTPEILAEYKQKYPDKLSIILRTQNIGPKKNSLDLFSKASGDYIALLDGDDYWSSEDKLEKIINFLEKSPDHIGAFHNIQVIDQNDNPIVNHEYHFYPKFTDINSLKEHLDGKLMMTLSLVFRNIFLDKAKFEEYTNLLGDVRNVCDFSLKSYLTNIGRFKYFKDILGSYRYVNHGGSSWNAQPTIVKNEDFLIIYKQHIIHFGPIAETALDFPYFMLHLRTSSLYLSNLQLRKFLQGVLNFEFNVFLRSNIYRYIFKRMSTRFKF